MKNAFLVRASLLLCCGCGAEQYTDEASSKRFSAEVQAIADSLVKDKIKYPHQSIVARMNEIMSGMSSQTRRIEAANSYATMLWELVYIAHVFDIYSQESTKRFLVSWHDEFGCHDKRHHAPGK